MAVTLYDALEAGDLDRIIGILGEMTRAHQMKRVAQETGLGRESLHKSIRPGASPEFDTVLKVLRSLGFRVRVNGVADLADEQNNRNQYERLQER